MQDYSHEFASSARSVLSFLESDHGFDEESTTTPRDSRSVYATYTITYRKQLNELPDLRVRLISTPARGELFLECNRGDGTNPDQTVDARELLAIAIPNAAVKFKQAVSDAIGRPGIMQEHFLALAKALRNHGHRFFNLDESLWDDVHRLREDRRLQYERDEADRDRQRSVHESELAFKAKDWQRVVKLLQSLTDNLTNAQSARLNYARKQLQEQG